MKVAALFLAGSAILAPVQAQSDVPHIEMVPMPDTLPLVFFSPEPLAGAMPEPLAMPAAAVRDVAVREPVPAQKPAAYGAAPGYDVVAQAEPAAVEDAEAAAAAPEAEPSTATTVRVIVENVESSDGTVNVAVCDTGFSPEGCPYHTAVPAAQGFVEALFRGVPPGAYAVVGYHDVNNNDEFDKFLGVPREPYALSGEAARALVPEFSDAILRINQGENYVIIRMKRLGSG